MEIIQHKQGEYLNVEQVCDTPTKINPNFSQISEQKHTRLHKSKS